LIYFRPFGIKDLLKLYSLTSEFNGIGFEEWKRLPAHTMLGIWGAVKEIYEIRNKKKKEDEESQSSGVSMPGNVSSMLSMARSMSSGGFKAPSGMNMPKMPTMR